MSKSRDKKIKKLRRKSICPPIIGFLLAMTFSVFLLFVIATFLVLNSIKTDLISSVATVNRVVESMNELVVRDVPYQDALNALENSLNHPEAIHIMNSDGHFTAGYGVPIDLQRETILEDELNLKISLNEEAAKELEASNHALHINFQELVEVFRSIDMEAARSQDVARMNSYLEQVAYKWDYWISKPLVNQDQVYIKSSVDVTVNDVFSGMMFGLLVGIIVLFLLTILCVSTIKNIIAQRKLLNLLFRDEVTSDYNYVAFKNQSVKRLCGLINRNREFALVDISWTKYQNYCTLNGSAMGESILVQLSKDIRKGLKMGEVFARVVDANYVLLLKVNSSEDKGTLVRTRLETLFKEWPFVAGVYFIPTAANDNEINRTKKNIDIDKICMKARIAKQGVAEETGVMIYNHDMWEKELWEQKVETMMQDALDNQEFQVYVQPKYHPSTEELVGGEALVRWVSPTEGFIPPGRFIPIFEKIGFVTKLDDYMIDHTAALQAKWLSEGKKIVPISVNVSRAHFAQADLAEHIRDIVDRYPVPHEFIEIELTESAFFDDKKALFTTVRKLQQYGFDVSMDDFGSGYSSLNSLKDLPLNVLKLDAEFFRGDDFDTRGEIVVAEAIALAKRLDMRIVAEGVEKKEQVDFLAGQNCDMIQGYYFAKPMPADEYSDRMSNQASSEVSSTESNQASSEVSSTESN